MASLGFQHGWSVLVDPIAVFAALLIASWAAATVRKGRGVTIGDLLTGSSAPLKWMLGLISFLVYQLLTAAQFVAIGELLGPYFPGIAPAVLMSAAGIVVLVYVGSRGFNSVTRTDNLQFVMVAFLFAIPVLWLISTDDSVQTMRPSEIPTAPYSLLLYLILPLFFIPVSHDTNIRIKAAASLGTARMGLLAGGLLYVAFLGTAIGVGVFMRTRGVALDNPQHVLPTFFAQRLGSLQVIGTIAILAAVVSTLDSFAFDAIVSASNDLVKPFNKRLRLDERRITTASAITVLGLGLVIAVRYPEILGLILLAMLLYVSIFIPVALGRYWGISDRVLIGTATITTIAIVFCKTVAFTPPLEPGAFIALHVAFLAAAKIVSRA